MKKHFLHGNHINTLKWLLFALFVLMNIGGSVAQVGKVSITGVVVDELGEPMVGVNVVVKGTTNGTVTIWMGNILYLFLLMKKLFSFIHLLGINLRRYWLEINVRLMLS